MIWLRAETPSTSHPLPSSTPPSGTPPLLPIPLPTPSPPLLLASTVYREGVSEVTLPPQKRLCIVLGLRYEFDESSSAPTARPTRGFRSDYRFFGTLDNEIRHDTDEIYVRLDDAQDDRLLMSSQLNMLHRDRRAHTRTTRLMEIAARLSPDLDQEVAGSRPQETGTTCGDLDTDKDTADTGHKMAPKRATRSTPATITTTTSVTNAQLKALIDQGVANALAARDADRSQNGKDSHDSGTGVRRQAPLARECTYPDFMKCKPLYFKGTEGFIEMTYDLTWWKSHVKTVSHDVSYAMTWTNLKKKMTDKYCPRGEIKKLEAEMMFPEESDKIEKYVGGLPDMIHRRKAKRKSFYTKTTPSSKRLLQLLHMDLCGLMRVESINGKKYVLVIVDDYSRYTWTHFLRIKDETPKFLMDFLKLVQRGLPAQVRTVRTDKGTKFLNKTLHAYFAQEGFEHQTFVARTPKQNGVVERQNRTLVEADRTMLSTAKVPLDGENLDKIKEKESSTITTADAPNQREQQHTTPSTSTTVAANTPPSNIQTTPETTSKAPTQAPIVTAT
ncbi:putative reverse transcriptase domain-containing protein [Tanacetum coccineum]|uniref:Reverse transcriptase domain-containing protein n=1 Tax=Tanacetum coccineum TaxID=301880 RepID=A0ABQ5J802_9ASTR